MKFISTLSFAIIQTSDVDQLLEHSEFQDNSYYQDHYNEQKSGSSSDNSRGENAEIEGSVSEAPLEIITHKNRYGESNKIIDMIFNMFTGNIEEKRI